MQNLSNWGNFPVIHARVFQPEHQQALLETVSGLDTFIARGNGRCYGDAALSHAVVSTLSLRKILHFDVENGIIECESGVLLTDLLAIIVPAGWFFHVTPGTHQITVGGAVACDVHGKNHSTKGCFSNWLTDFTLLRENKEIVRCSREENSTLFWQTCGGMGWTGVILTARFQLMRFPGAKVHQTTVRADTLENLLQTFDAHYARHEYAAAWIDCLASGKNLGRGAIYFGRHLAEKATPPTTFQAPTALNIPGFAPSWLLNRHSIQCYNQWVWYRSQSGEKTMGLHAYFYPLDQLKNWNRLYGRRGFLQYQFCIPEARAAEALQKAIALIQRGPDRPFLSVLKRHGDRPPEALHSFPIRGWSLALDFPRTTTIFGLIQQLDDLIWEYGGKVYLAKDAASHGRMGRVDPKVFGNAQFDSHLKQRILNTL